MFRGRDLAGPHSDFQLKYDKKKPHTRYAPYRPAFFRKSAVARTDGDARAYFSDGVLYTGGRMRGALPIAQRAVRPATFIEVITLAPPGVDFVNSARLGRSVMS